MEVSYFGLVNSKCTATQNGVQSAESAEGYGPTNCILQIVMFECLVAVFECSCF